ncbi:hypothetical protein NQ318_014046 [Aromia moschata]|uniref:Uncharacterized protein n=1 Tax=Aromia moschata TaxID=1265417 RepID=A0AAV8YZZ8_9CUCU|nr:hypothetical protein NQ318_014046 [Aromia moschata]
MPEGMTVVAALQPQDIQLIQAQVEPEKGDKEPTPVALIKNELNKEQDLESTASVSIPAQYLQSANLQEYLQKMQNTALPFSLQQFLKFNSTDIKREQITEDGVIETVSITTPDGQGHLIMHEVAAEMETEESGDDPNDKTKKKKKYKKKPPKPKKPKPGQVHIATALGRHHPVLLS